MARCESEIVTATSRSSPATSTRLQHLIPELSKAIENERTYPEDRFQAQTCIAWIYWIEEQYKLVAATISLSLPNTVDSATEKQGPLREWTQVCIFKCAYIGGEYAVFAMAVWSLRSLRGFQVLHKKLSEPPQRHSKLTTSDCPIQ